MLIKLETFTRVGDDNDVDDDVGDDNVGGDDDQSRQADKARPV